MEKINNRDLEIEDAQIKIRKPSKNNKIEFLRFVFAISILLFHVQKRFIGVNGTGELTEWVFFGHGCIGVEFFFLVSGYLLAASWKKKQDTPVELIGAETAGVMKRKILSVFPYHLFAMIPTTIINMIYLEKTVSDRIYYVLNAWPSVFMIQVFGFESNWANRLTWYIDVWLMVTFIFYPLGRKYYDVFVKIVCPLLALFILGYLDYTTNALSGVEEHVGLFYKVFLRGMGEMALGCCAYSLTRRVNRLELTKFGKRFFAVVEVLGYIGILAYCNLEYFGRYEFLILFLMFVLLIISFSEINPARDFFNKPIFSWMGRYSLFIYLNQFYCIRLVQSIGVGLPYPVKLVMAIGFTFIGSVACEKTVNWIMKKSQGLFIVHE